MDVESLREQLSSLSIPKNHITLGLTNLIQQSKALSTLLKHKKLPTHPFSDLQIQSIILTLSTLDTNREFSLNNHNSSGSGTTERWIGVGEREGRIYSSLVSSRNFGFGHGMGRSGDIMEPQPKAVGSSILVQLTKELVLDCMKRGAGLRGDKDGGPAKHGLILPLCTGMSVALILSSLREEVQVEVENDDNDNDTNDVIQNQPVKDVVLWSRIDQKSCYKAVQTAGFKCVVVPTKVDGDMVVTDMDSLQENVNKYRGRVIAIISTTSCFAPRVPDQIDEIGKLCLDEDVAHIINNAYGLQCQTTVKLINRACVLGRVDAIVSSTDKNFLVPVGGAIITSPNEKVIQTISKVYAGRASSAPILDLFITLLSMGLNGYQKLLEDRRTLVGEFQSKLEQIAERYGERTLSCPKNTISFGITLDSLSKPIEGESADQISKREMTSLFGSMLFTRCISGTRVVAKGGSKTISGQKFVGFGSSTDDYPHSYLTAACAIGLTEDENEEFFVRLDRCFKDFWTKRRKEVKKKVKKESAEKEK
jgi:O-phospho-L-seryl-tRNASec:L-selenocysteinyl-tRNA synthase